MGDWADDKAAEVLHLIWQPTVTLDEVGVLLAANLRLADAQGEMRAMRQVSAALKGETQ